MSNVNERGGAGKMMKINKTVIGLAVCLGVGLHGLSHAVTSPSTLNIKVSKMWLSESESCTSPVLIMDDSTSPEYRDFVGSPVLDSPTVTHGTYKCVIIKMSDQIQFVPAANEGVCVAGTQYTIDVFRAGESSSCPGESIISGATSSEEYPCVYVSRNGAADPPQPFDSSSPFLLASDWVVGNDITGTFVTDFNNKVTGVTQCDVQAPDFDFR